MTSNQDWQPKLRFPAFRNASQWSEKKLGELFKERVDKGHPEKPVLSASQEMGVIPYALLKKSVIRDKQNLVGYKLVKSGDFVISLRSFEGGFEYSRYEGIISPAYVILERTREINDIYFQLLFKSEPFIAAVRNTLNNSLRDGKSISYKQARNILLPVPEVDEQEQIAHCVSSVDDLITTQKRKLDALTSYKQGLMQQLFPSPEDSAA